MTARTHTRTRAHAYSVRGTAPSRLDAKVPAQYLVTAPSPTPVGVTGRPLYMGAFCIVPTQSPRQSNETANPGPEPQSHHWHKPYLASQGTHWHARMPEAVRSASARPTIHDPR